VNAPFTVTISAQDITNAVFTNFTGTVILSATNGLPVNPPLSGTFDQGVWTGTVAISQVAAGIVLKADDDAGHTGLANSINILNPPSLGALNFGTSVTAFWRPRHRDSFGRFR